MNKNALLILTALFGACLFLFACRKNIDNYLHDRENVPSQQIESAKIWRLQHLENRLFKTSGSYGLLKPQWADAYSLRSSSGKEILVVPAPEKYVGNKEFTIRRFFVFSSSSSNVDDGKIIEFIGRNYNVSDHIDKLLKNYESQRLEGFNGGILTYDINYRLISGVHFANGKKQTSRVKIENFSSMAMTTTKANSQLKSTATTSGLCGSPVKEYFNMPPNLAPDCLIQAWMEETSVDGCVTHVTYTYISHTCPAGVSTGEGGGQGSGQGSGSGSGSGSGTSEGSPNYGGPGQISELSKILGTTCLTGPQLASLSSTVDSYLSEEINSEWACLHKKQFNYLISKNVKIAFCTDGNSNVMQKYNPLNKSIIFKDDLAITLTNTFEHEFFHAFQDQMIPGGTTQYAPYGPNASNITYPDGFINTEFETALFQDIIRDRSSQDALQNSNVPTAIKQEYVDWLNTITANNTKYPKTFNDLDGKYFYFMEKFKQYSGYAGMGNIKTDMNPNTLLTLFSTTNCK